ncbi:hypothetical protein GGR57DRAFT_517467 [Xylariaceae sp. FL1272]|nr:hypothetical protein GGR57DRAFT_517467 [Xylariaceae sp. FL1272]
MPHYVCDPNGDLVIVRKIGSGKVKESFLASTEAIQNKAPSWFIQMQEQWQEKRDFDPTESGGCGDVISGVRVVYLTGYTGLKIILDIILTRDDAQVPKSLSLSGLVEVCVTAHVYHIEKMLAPWVDDWIKEAKRLPEPLSPPEMQFNGMWVIIAYCLGLKDEFVYHANVYVVRYGNCFNERLELQDLLEYVKTILGKMIHACVRPVKERTRYLRNPESPQCTCNEEGCNKKMLAHMFSHLRAEKLLTEGPNRERWYMLPFEQLPQVPEKLLSAISRMENLPSACLASWVTEYQTEAVKAFAKIVDTQAEALREHFDRQAQIYEGAKRRTS